VRTSCAVLCFGEISRSATTSKHQKYHIAETEHASHQIHHKKYHNYAHTHHKSHHKQDNTRWFNGISPIVGSANSIQLFCKISDISKILNQTFQLSLQKYRPFRNLPAKNINNVPNQLNASLASTGVYAAG